MAHREIAVPFTSPHGGKGTHFFAYPLHNCPESAAAVRAATADAVGEDAVRHRRGAEIGARPSTTTLRTPALWSHTPLADG